MAFRDAPGDGHLCLQRRRRPVRAGRLAVSLDLRVPDDMAVIGVDGTPGCGTGAAAAHHGRPLHRALARELARRVVDALDGKPVSTEPVQDELGIRIRQSA
ncbi:hypothetical protein [Streptomyces shaanxiensis]